KFEDNLESKTGVKLEREVPRDLGRVTLRKVGKDEVQREPEHGVEGENVTVQCGAGSEGGAVRVVGQGFGLAYSSTINTGDRTEMQVEVVKYNPSTYSNDLPSGALLTWKLSDSYGGKLSINGCTATYTAPKSIGTRQKASVTIIAMLASLPAPTSGGGEGGPRNMMGASATGHITVRNPNYGGTGGGGGKQCGKEWLQVSISGPYSYSQNTFWLSGPGTGNLWWGPFTNSRTFQPIAPGNYALQVAYADGTQKTYNINVPACSYYKFVQSNQGWGR
ncbi:MAG: hypothetical protein HY555_00540, partial [Euryarchaeota archaeon]|nr:hypothetical protein [Euryarchaeota archaeon]